MVRVSNDLDSVIKQIKSKYGYQNIHIVGTCAGALTTIYYIANKKDKEDIKSLTLISPYLQMLYVRLILIMVLIIRKTCYF